MQINKWSKTGAAKVKNVHFLGIGGSGMCGLAEILNSLGYKVSGSDEKDSTTIQRLVKLGIDCHIGHKAKHAKFADLIVRSGAVAEDNLELQYGVEQGIPIIQRAEMLAEIMRFGLGIAVAGSHGKTTTTSMMARVLSAGGDDVTFIVGGLVKSSNSNGKLGVGNYVVAEADESDASFLFLRPYISVVTNIDAEHMYQYKNMQELKDTFLKFLHHLPFDGLAVICVDDPIVREIESEINRPLVRYGFDKSAEYRAKGVKQQGLETSFTVVFPDKTERTFTIGVPGRHNVLNALACIATACTIGMKPAQISKGINNFVGVSRRQDVLGTFSGVTESGEVLKNIMLIDDYGHHPTEIECTLNAIKGGWPRRRCVMIFQPHRYSRTQESFDEFVRVLGMPDELFILDIYAAGEKPIKGINSKALSSAIAAKSKKQPLYVKDSASLLKALPKSLKSNDLLITQGAGNIGALAHDLCEHSLYMSKS
ncbi:MAG: UDP-N-acetylmuramate--L-alanine ligase [Gammaproteobacteria bacterium]|nr:UDP-N-acetylmuramate--L-alanine ligase [Gammaproteobacteria bacterium]